jgi:hypothetical protein
MVLGCRRVDGAGASAVLVEDSPAFREVAARILTARGLR